MTTTPSDQLAADHEKKAEVFMDDIQRILLEAFKLNPTQTDVVFKSRTDLRCALQELLAQSYRRGRSAGIADLKKYINEARVS